MAKKSKTIKSTIIIAIIIALITGCANQLAPGGGPVDTMPPQIVEVNPQSGTVNFSDDRFTLTFSEYVDKRSVIQALFVSPHVAKGFEYDWSGTTISIIFKDTLRQATTYTITVGTEVVDLNNRNNMAEPFTFTFSTGAKIDTGKISGRIYDKDPNGVMVYAYKSVSGVPEPDTLRPDYISQVGKNGKYSLQGLSSGEYYIFAVRDKFRDLLYQKNDDEIGVQSFDLVISDERKEYNDVDFFLSIEDTLAPKISNLFMRDRNKIVVEFSERVDSTKLSVNNFYLFDSTAQRRIDPFHFYKGDARNNQFYLAIKDTLIPGNNNFFISDSLVDIKNNISGKEFTSFTVKTETDTLPVKILKIGGAYPEGKVDYENPVITVSLNKGVNKELISDAIIVSDDKNDEISYMFNFIDDASFTLKLNAKLKQRNDYTVKLDLAKFIDAAGNKADSIYTHKFTTASELDFSGVSGTVSYKNYESNIYVVVESADNTKQFYKQKIDSRKSFNLPKILPGKYLLWSFVDKNNDGRYSHGSEKPFTHSEQFKFYPDTLNLRARWPVGDLKIDFD